MKPLGRAHDSLERRLPGSGSPSIPGRRGCGRPRSADTGFSRLTNGSRRPLRVVGCSLPAQARALFEDRLRSVSGRRRRAGRRSGAGDAGACARAAATPARSEREDDGRTWRGSRRTFHLRAARPARQASPAGRHPRRRRSWLRRRAADRVGDASASAARVDLEVPDVHEARRAAHAVEEDARGCGSCPPPSHVDRPLLVELLADRSRPGVKLLMSRLDCEARDWTFAHQVRGLLLRGQDPLQASPGLASSSATSRWNSGQLVRRHLQAPGSPSGGSSSCVRLLLLLFHRRATRYCSTRTTPPMTSGDEQRRRPAVPPRRVLVSALSAMCPLPPSASPERRRPAAGIGARRPRAGASLPSPRPPGS